MRGVVAIAVVCGLAALGCSPASDEPALEAPPSSSGPGAAATPSSTAQATDPVPTSAPRAADDPAALAAQIEQAERVIRDPSSGDDEVAAAAHVQQVAYRRLGATTEWDDAVLAALPEDLRDAARRQAAARREFRGMHTTLSETLPAWRIVDPAPAEDLLGFYREAEDAFGVPWNYLAAINLVETGMGRIQGLSTAGARGPMQFIPTTWDRWGEGDIDDPHDAILAAGRYLQASGANDDLARALWSYNNHDNYVRGVTDYAQIMAADPQTFFGFYHWQIHFLSAHGDVWLPVGYEQPEPVPVLDYVAENPGHLTDL